MTETGSGNLPTATALLPNFPYPFNASTAIRFQTSGPSYASLDIFDISGRQVINLVSEYLNGTVAKWLI